MKILHTTKHHNSCLHIFGNGLALSVIWGMGSYTKYRDFPMEEEIKDPEEFEIALMSGKHGKFVGQDLLPEVFNGDDVAGYITPNELYDIMKRIDQLSSGQACISKYKMFLLWVNYYWNRLIRKEHVTYEQ